MTNYLNVIARSPCDEAIHSCLRPCCAMDCFAELAMTLLDRCSPPSTVIVREGAPALQQVVISAWLKPQPAAISERISARNSSISLRPFLVSMCQKVQQLQASEPCATAPMRWNEPTLSPSLMAP